MLPLTWVESRTQSGGQISRYQAKKSQTQKSSKGPLGSTDRTQKICSVGHNQEIGRLIEKFGVRKSDPKNYPSSSTTQIWWTERKIVGPKIGAKKLSIVVHNP